MVLTTLVGIGAVAAVYWAADAPRLLEAARRLWPKAVRFD
jgi:hypothetical protein